MCVCVCVCVLTRNDSKRDPICFSTNRPVIVRMVLVRCTVHTGLVHGMCVVYVSACVYIVGTLCQCVRLIKSLPVVSTS